MSLVIGIWYFLLVFCAIWNFKCIRKNDENLTQNVTEFGKKTVSTFFKLPFIGFLLSTGRGK